MHTHVRHKPRGVQNSRWKKRLFAESCGSSWKRVARETEESYTGREKICGLERSPLRCARVVARRTKVHLRILPSLNLPLIFRNSPLFLCLSEGLDTRCFPARFARASRRVFPCGLYYSPLVSILIGIGHGLLILPGPYSRFAAHL